MECEKYFVLFRPEYMCYTLYSMVMLLHSSLKSLLVGKIFSRWYLKKGSTKRFACQIIYSKYISRDRGRKRNDKRLPFRFPKNSTKPPTFRPKIGIPEGVRNSTGRGYLRQSEGNSIENLEKYRGQGFRGCRDLNGGSRQAKSEDEDEDNCIQILAS